MKRLLLGMVWLVCCLAGGLASGVAWAAPPEPATLTLHNRRIVEFRAALGGDTPAQRVDSARAALQEALRRGGAGEVALAPVGPALRFEVDGQPVFFLVAEDLGDPAQGGMLESGAQKVAQRLTAALGEARRVAEPRELLQDTAIALAATALVAAALWALWRARRWVLARLLTWGRRVGDEAGARSALLAASERHLLAALRWFAQGAAWVFTLLALDLWAAFVLRQFAYTRPWGDAAQRWLLGVLERFVQAAASAVPGLLTALLILLLARGLASLLGALMNQVERGELQLGWLDADTAPPTRRIGVALVWLFALALAYPHLPGAASESFKGVTVLAGLMVSLGASGVVGQAMAGFTLMYSRSLRPGEYVKIGDTEGTVVSIGLFATKVHTGMGEEVSLPNTVVMSQSVRNYSRLVDDGRFVLQAAVTIGYATPWRRVHAMLLEAARRTPGVATTPAPSVVQTALSDFYVEYRLLAQGDHGAPRRRAEAISALNGHIQDVFNEQGVQIMSPHYLADPPAPQVVPPGTPWSGPTGSPPLTP